MDSNSNVSNLRRHNSLPVTLRRRSTTMTNRSILRNETTTTSAKSNPYVGWFRHSPSTTTTSRMQLRNSSFETKFKNYETSLKNSPYVGFFSHAPSFRQSVVRSQLQQELVKILQSIPKKTKGVYRLEDLLLSGHLLGGAKHHETTLSKQDQFQFVQSICTSLQRSSYKSSSSTLKVITRLACWFLLPLCEEETPRHVVLAPLAEDGESSCSEEDSLDNYDTIHGSGESSSNSNTTASNVVSRVKDLEYEVSGEERLDYVITQMDIARMTRNASRHLDVESITKLPTTTYHPKQEEPPKPEERKQEDTEGWSWMMVQRKQEEDIDVCDAQTEEPVPKPAQDEQDVCVICLEHFCSGDRLRVLPCDHSFHVGCIDRWLSGSHSFDDCVTSGCPTCKKHPCCDDNNGGSENSDGSVPSWAFARIGDALARESRHF